MGALLRARAPPNVAAISVVTVAALGAELAWIGALVIRGTTNGIRWGLGVCLLGMAEAGLMIANPDWSPTGGQTVGAPDGGAGLPLTGWSTAHGDLRIAHFVGLHALQALPLLAWLLARRTGLDGRTRARLIACAGIAQAALVGVLEWRALRGQALLRPEAQAVAALAALLVLAAAGVVVVLPFRPA